MIISCHNLCSERRNWTQGLGETWNNAETGKDKQLQSSLLCEIRNPKYLPKFYGLGDCLIICSGCTSKKKWLMSFVQPGLHEDWLLLKQKIFIIEYVLLKSKLKVPRGIICQVPMLFFTDASLKWSDEFYSCFRAVHCSLLPIHLLKKHYVDSSHLRLISFKQFSHNH